MKGIDSNTCDEISLKLSGLIGMFDLLVDLSTGTRDNTRATMSDFAFFVSKELQELYKKVCGVDYE